MADLNFWARRRFLSGVAAFGGGLLLGAAPRLARADDHDARDHADTPDVTPAEDLMREHGLLRRVLLIYQECIRRLDAGQPLPPAALHDAADIIRTFVENYHEKLEEDYLFPRFESANLLADLTRTLRLQHQAGRLLTAELLRLSAASPVPDDRARLADRLRQFIRMYQPHAAREDTVLFPALHRVYSEKEYDQLGDTFEDKEQALFGPGGFEKMVASVAAIEKSLGIYDLAQFTPKAG